MKKMTGILKHCMGFLLVLVCMFNSVSVLATELSDDNSLASLGVQNGTVQEEFVYSTWEYNVVVEPGTTELYLEPTTSNANASITSITGTVLEDGKATVLINTASESGLAMTYTLHVTSSDESTTESQTETEAQTEAQSETQAQTETQAETQAETEDQQVTILQAQVDKLKSNNSLIMKIVYGLIAFAVVLLILLINFILKNRDLKGDVREAEDKLAYQTNEFARKEKAMASDHYYAPSMQEEPRVMPEPMRAEAPIVEETFGTAAPKQEAPENTEDTEKKEEKDVDVTMVDL